MPPYFRCLTNDHVMIFDLLTYGSVRILVWALVSVYTTEATDDLNLIFRQVSKVDQSGIPSMRWKDFADLTVTHLNPRNSI